jgi:hypothetical protein
MTARNPVVVAQRLVSEVLRSFRRISRQVERRLRYRRLGWV